MYCSTRNKLLFVLGVKNLSEGSLQIWKSQQAVSLQLICYSTRRRLQCGNSSLGLLLCIIHCKSINICPWPPSVGSWAPVDIIDKKLYAHFFQIWWNSRWHFFVQDHCWEYRQHLYVTTFYRFFVPTDSFLYIVWKFFKITLLYWNLKRLARLERWFKS